MSKWELIALFYWIDLQLLFFEKLSEKTRSHCGICSLFSGLSLFNLTVYRNREVNFSQIECENFAKTGSDFATILRIT